MIEPAQNMPRRQLAAVLVIWLVLLALAGAAVFTLNRNALRILHWLEYVEASRYSKVLVLYREGEKHAKKALQALPTQSTTATLSAHDHHLSSAITLFSRALQLDPRPEFSEEKEPYLTLLGDLYGAAGNLPLQLVSYGRAALVQNDLAGAQRYADRATSESVGPPTPETRYFLAQVYLRSNQTGKARTLLTELTAQPNAPAAAHSLLAELLLREGKSDDALQQYEAAVSKAPQQVNYRKSYAGALVLMGQPDRAVAIYEQGLKSGWDDGNYLHLYGDLLQTQKQPQRAVEILTQAAKVEPSSGDIELSLARAYQALNKPRYAQRHIQRAVALKPSLQGELLK